MKEEEQLEAENAEALAELSRGLALLDVAEGGDSLHPWAEIMTKHDASFVASAAAEELRHFAVGRFMVAGNRLNNRNSWIWFQIGWNLLACEDALGGLPLALYALNAALEIEPDCRPAHLAIAWVLYQQQCTEANQDEVPPESLWLGSIGEHLRKALEGIDWRDTVNMVSRAAGWFGRPTGVLLEPQGCMRPPYFITKGSKFAAVRALEALVDLVPESHRFWHAYLMADLVEGDGLRRRWEEEALRWPVQDDLALLVVNTSLASLEQRAGHLISSLRCYQTASDHLLRAVESGDPGFLNWFALPLEWIDQCPYKGGELPDGSLELFLKMADAVLAVWRRIGMDEFCFQHAVQQLGVVAAWAGRRMLDAHDRERAETYLLAALEFEQEAVRLAEEEMAEEWGDELPPVSGANDWRVITARAWRDIHIEKGQWQQADASNNRILELLPGDHDARDKKLTLAQIVSSTALQEVRARDKLDAEMSRIFSSILPAASNPVSVSSDTQSKVAELVRSLEQLVEASAVHPEAIQRMFDEVHDFAQRDTQLPPRAIRSADQRLLDELGSETFDKLHPDSRLFLETAEAFYVASEGVAPQLDSALIAVEYAKVVETELRTRFLDKLAEMLSAAGYKGSLRVSRAGETVMARRLTGLSLGEAAYLLNSFADQAPDKTVLRVIESMRVPADVLRQLSDDIDKVADYRNDAAHVGKVSRDAVARLRNLLIREGFLRRLEDLISRCMDM